MLVLHAAPTLVVEETSSPEGVFWLAKSGPVKLSGMASRAGGRQGWSFDLTRDCDLAVVRPRKSDDGDELVLLRSAAGGFSGNGKVVYFSSSGLTSPVFSPDGRRLLVATGADHVVEVELSSQRVTDLGPGIIPLWDALGRPVLYRYDEGRRLHVLERSEAGKRIEIGRDERGINLAPIVAGSLPIGFPLPLISAASEVVGMIGATTSGIARMEARVVTAAGVGCASAVTFPDGEGGYVSIVPSGSSWVLAAGNACELRGFGPATVKRVSCETGAQSQKAR